MTYLTEATGRWTLRQISAAYDVRGVSSTAEAAIALVSSDPDRVLAIEGERSLTARSAVADATALASCLRDSGILPGETLSYILPNQLEALVVNLAAGMAGLVVNPIVPIYRSAELRHILRDAHTAAIVLAGGNFADMVSDLHGELCDLKLIIDVTTDWHRTLARGRKLRTLPMPTVKPGDVKLILYTSGTTGPAKGVIHSHGTLARVLAMNVRNLGLGGNFSFLMPSPIGHVTGYLWGLEAPIRHGSKVVLMPRWDPAEAVRLIDRHAIDATSGAAPFLQDVISAARAAGTRLPSLRRFASGGASVNPALVREALLTFERASVFRVYGSTEAPNVGQGYTQPEDRTLAADTDGRALDYELRLVDLAGRDVAEGRQGELLVRGPSLFCGYTDPSLNDAAFDPAGFFRTGDLGERRPDGALVITGRRKDLIIRGGENLSPKEIEDALLDHPDVAEVAIVGVPHMRLGEKVGACVVPEAGQSPSLASLARYLIDAGFARQKCPEHLLLVPQLPRTPSGKVQKDEVRRMMKAALPLSKTS
jgi:acyl-CoA synthetase (AMP-forming)/AMP-acid ligase II